MGMTADLQPAAERMKGLVAGVSDDQLGQPTPCPSYRVADLLDHIGSFALAFDAAARKDLAVLQDPPGQGDAARLPDDWRERIPRDLTTMVRAWSEPAAWEGMTRIGGGDSPGNVAGMVGLEELVVHGWDLARASGQDYAPDQGSLDGALTTLAMFQQPGKENPPGSPFGSAIEVSGTAALLDRVVALSGRDPSWSA
jgi:uncharacterized protein (TIGR03086 family)